MPYFYFLFHMISYESVQVACSEICVPHYLAFEHFLETRREKKGKRSRKSGK
jgi:hypothetical protein